MGNIRKLIFVINGEFFKYFDGGGSVFFFFSLFNYFDEDLLMRFKDLVCIILKDLEKLIEGVNVERYYKYIYYCSLILKYLDVYMLKNSIIVFI